MKTKKLKIILYFFFIPLFCFSQKKDVYYLLDKNHFEYLIPNNLNSMRKGNVIRICNRKDYLKRQKKIKQKKLEGKYNFDPECGCDNVNINVFCFEFEIISRKKMKTENLNKLNLVNYKWIKENSWKPINRKYYKVNFKDLYFLYKTGNDTYVFFKVGITITVV